jgi:hypothetical protein
VGVCVQPIVIKYLKDFVGGEELDITLCPVRCLHRYVQRTSDDHTLKRRLKLFIPHSSTLVSELSGASLALYIKAAVSTAYQHVDADLQKQFRVNPHQLHLLSASIAKASNGPVEDILKSGYRQSHSTFTEFYLRCPAVHSDSLFSQIKVSGRQPLE